MISRESKSNSQGSLWVSEVYSTISAEPDRDNWKCMHSSVHSHRKKIKSFSLLKKKRKRYLWRMQDDCIRRNTLKICKRVSLTEDGRNWSQRTLQKQWKLLKLYNASDLWGKLNSNCLTKKTGEITQSISYIFISKVVSQFFNLYLYCFLYSYLQNVLSSLNLCFNKICSSILPYLNERCHSQQLGTYQQPSKSCKHSVYTGWTGKKGGIFFLIYQNIKMRLILHSQGQERAFCVSVHTYHISY